MLLSLFFCNGLTQIVSLSNKERLFCSFTVLVLLFLAINYYGYLLV